MQNQASDHNQMSEYIGIGVVPGDLVQSAQEGSHYAFDMLQRTYSSRLFKQIIAITRHHEDAEDALQDALYKAWVALPLFERRCHIYTWMSRIAINCALMKVRRRQRLREFSLDGQSSGDDRETAIEIQDPCRSPEDLCSDDELMRQLASVVESLDPISKDVLRLRANEDYSMEDIAGVLNVTVAAAKARLYRARHLLKGLLPNPGYGGLAIQRWMVRP